MIDEFIIAAFPWVVMALAVAIAVVYLGKENKDGR